MTTPLSTPSAPRPTGATAPTVPVTTHDAVRTPRDAAVARMMDVFNTVQMRAEAILKAVAGAHDLGVSDLRALYFVHATEAATPKQVSEYLDLSSGATTSLVDRMVAAGHVERVPHPTDRRSNVLVVAPRGAEVMQAEIGFYLEVFGGVDGDATEIEALAARLEALHASMRDHVEDRFGATS